MNKIAPQVTFDKAPLNEVVFGVQFFPNPFTLNDYFSYGSTIKDSFPQTSHHPLICEQGEIIGPPYSLLPRTWYISNDEQFLIQFQFNRFHFNWRQLSAKDKYPRFQNLFPDFLKKWESFVEYFSQQKIQPLRYELTYINHIDASSNWKNPNDTKDILRVLQTSDISSDFELASHDLRLVFADTSNNQILVQVKNGKKIADDNLIMILEISVRGQPGELSLEDWFRSAHNNILSTFDSITTTASHKTWGKV